MTISKIAAYRNDINRLYRDGVSAGVIARQFDVTTTTITNHLKKVGLMEGRPRGFIPDSSLAVQKKAIKLFNNGVRPCEIIKTLGISKTCFYSLINRNGLTKRGHDGFKLSDKSKKA